MRRVEYVIH